MPDDITTGSNNSPEADIITSSDNKWVKVKEFIKGNIYFFAVAGIIALPVIVVIFNRFESPLKKTSTPVSTPPVDNRLTCPITKGFCDNFAEVTKDNTFIGIGIQKLATGAAMVAAFDGKIIPSTRITASKEVYFIAYLVNETQNKQATYWYKGPPVKQRMIKKGEVITTFSGVAIKEYLGNAFIFSLFDSKGNPIHLSQKDFQ